MARAFHANLASDKVRDSLCSKHSGRGNWRKNACSNDSIVPIGTRSLISRNPSVKTLGYYHHRLPKIVQRGKTRKGSSVRREKSILWAASFREMANHNRQSGKPSPMQTTQNPKLARRFNAGYPNPAIPPSPRRDDRAFHANSGIAQRFNTRRMHIRMILSSLSGLDLFISRNPSVKTLGYYHQAFRR